MSNQIKVQIKSVFGHEKIYPVCDKAEIFCNLVRQKTLTEHDIKNIKALGFEVEVEPTHPAKL